MRIADISADYKGKKQTFTAVDPQNGQSAAQHVLLDDKIPRIYSPVVSSSVLPVAGSRFRAKRTIELTFPVVQVTADSMQSKGLNRFKIVITPCEESSEEEILAQLDLFKEFINSDQGKAVLKGQKLL